MPRLKQVKRNKTFQNNERKFLQQTGGECTRTNYQPNANKAKELWNKI